MFRRSLINKYLNNGFSKADAYSEVDFAFEIVAGITPNDFLLEKEPSDAQKHDILTCVDERISSRAPIQQVLGKAFFMGDIFKVTKDTLTPRPETEILVRKAISLIENNKFKKVLDIGSGSGCIAIEIAKHLTEVEVISVDISQEALEVAQQNACKFGVLDRVEFLISDIFSQIREKFDLIVSNPPYIPLSEKANLQAEVRDFEPDSALFAQDKDGVDFYKKIILNAHKHLVPKGYLAFELGINQAGIVKELLSQNNFINIEILKDLDGIERVILAEINIS